MKNKIMLIVGHSFDKKGCYSKELDTHEYDFCMKVATELFAREMFYDVDLVLKSRNQNYSDLPKEVNSFNPDYVIELHLNSSDKREVQGTEHLYCNGSTRGKEMAEVLQKNCIKQFGFRDRGLDGRVNGENGHLLLSKTIAPCVIAEPFFLSDKTLTKEQLEDLKEKYIKYLNVSIREIINRQI